MILQMVAVYDLKAHSFANPIFLAHRDLAIRAFAEAARTPGNGIHKYPADHVLYHLGTFDDSTGAMSINPTLELLIAGASVSPDNVVTMEKKAS